METNPKKSGLAPGILAVAVLGATHAPQVMKWNDPQAAFEAAIKSGRLSASPWDWNFAAHYMYMGTQNGRDLFKSKETREYLK